MLFDLDGRQITRMPHKKDYDTWRANISNVDYDKAVDAIKEYISDKDVFTSSFIPGSNWIGGPYEPLYYACRQNEIHSGFFFGLIVWDVIMKDEDKWLFKPSEKEEGDPLGMTYWRRNQHNN